MPGSIQKALSDKSLSQEQMSEIYSPFLALTSRILGSAPHFLALAHASPLTHIFYLAALRPCFRLPQCDVNLLKISPATRRTALLESSIVHQCPYCTGHVAAMGDVVKGAMIMQCTRRGDMESAMDPGNELVKKLVGEVCGFPGMLAPDTKREFIEKFGEDGFDQISSMIAFMGFLNYTMGAAGMKLESRMVPFAEAATKKRKLPFNIRSAMKDDNQEDLGKEEIANVRRRGFIGTVLEHLRNVWGILTLIGPVSTAGLAEKKWYAGLPTTTPELDQWCERELKVELGVFKSVRDAVLKRSFALGLRLVYLEEDPQWTIQQKCLFLYVLASGIMNDRLKEDALKLYKMNGGSTDLTDILIVAKARTPGRNAFEAGLKFMHACAGFADNVPEDVVDDLVDKVKEHRAIMDLVDSVVVAITTLGEHPVEQSRNGSLTSDQV